MVSSKSPSVVLSPNKEVLGAMALNASMELSRFCSSRVLVSFSFFSICRGLSLLLILYMKENISEYKLSILSIIILEREEASLHIPLN